MYNTKKHSLILFHADWCGYCQSFMPIWNEFKTQINTDNYNIIEIESTNLFIQRIKGFKGYPSLFYINNNKVIEYNGSRDLKSLKDFVKI